MDLVVGSDSIRLMGTSELSENFIYEIYESRERAGRMLPELRSSLFRPTERATNVSNLFHGHPTVMPLIRRDDDLLDACSGEFETHLTLCFTEASSLENLLDFGRSHGLKCLHIVLDRGAVPSQPMLTRRGQGTLAGELAVASMIQRELATQGFVVSRVKIEAAPFNRGVPQTDLDQAGPAADRYFEHHMKLLLESAQDLTALAELAQRHSAHLSRNALRTRADGLQERFVTQRCWSMGHVSAHERLTQLKTELVLTGHVILEVEEEFVVYDTNLAIDAGWIQEGESK